MVRIAWYCGSMPWTLVGTGAGVALSAMLCGVSGLAFAIGVYLPLSSMLPIYVGGCVRALSLRGTPAGETAGSDPGVLAASGLVAGEALTGLGVAAAPVRKGEGSASVAAHGGWQGATLPGPTRSACTIPDIMFRNCAQYRVRKISSFVSCNN